MAAIQINNRIVLLDLNYTLVENSGELGYPHHQRLHMERYRKDLFEEIRNERVILITVRPIEFRQATLDRIEQQLGWLPMEAWFNEKKMAAPDCKWYLMDQYVFPRHGANPNGYFAIESNEKTREMYATLGIEAKHYREFMGIGPAPGSRRVH